MQNIRPFETHFLLGETSGGDNVGRRRRRQRRRSVLVRDAFPFSDQRMKGHRLSLKGCHMYWFNHPPRILQKLNWMRRLLLWDNAMSDFRQYPNSSTRSMADLSPGLYRCCLLTDYNKRIISIVPAAEATVKNDAASSEAQSSLVVPCQRVRSVD